MLPEGIDEHDYADIDDDEQLLHLLDHLHDNLEQLLVDDEPEIIMLLDAVDEDEDDDEIINEVIDDDE